jgi:hypothetical protein
MSKPVKRRCPQCGKVKLFRADCKTCGCSRPKTDPLAGRYFWLGQDESGACCAGCILARVSSSLYLVQYYELSPNGRESRCKGIVSTSAMRDWQISDKDYHDVWLVLRGMEAEEVRPAKSVSRDAA